MRHNGTQSKVFWRWSALGVGIMALAGIAVLVGFAVLELRRDDKSARAGPGNPTQLDFSWHHLSTASGDLPPPLDESGKQVAALILDVDLDGLNDFVIGSEEVAPALVWYRRHHTGWDRLVIEAEALPVEAGGEYHDIDGDGDPDVVMGAGWQTNEVWWWANPFPDYDPNTPWDRHTIKNTSLPKHHDQLFIDHDGNGQLELAIWNQKAEALLLAHVPDDPTNGEPWTLDEIYSWKTSEDLTKLGRQEGLEGFARADIDLDGIDDIVGGGRWFKHEGDGQFTAHIIDAAQDFGRVTTGQLVPGGRPEVVFGCGDCIGPLNWYEWDGTSWVAHRLLERDINFGHSLHIADIDNDGHLDVFVGEMRERSGGDNPDAKTMILYGDGTGNFVPIEIASSVGNHQSQVGDLDGDGDLDILGKPFRWDTPRLDIWLNGGGTNFPDGHWSSHIVAENDDRMVLICAADIDGDGYPDIIAGDAWFQNPGALDAPWSVNELPELGQVALAHDFDGDGDADLFGTRGTGSEPNGELLWLENTGSGGWEVHDVGTTEGNFLQGALAADLNANDTVEIVLSWHDEALGLFVVEIPAATQDPWTVRLLSPTSLGEEVNAGDIDGDGDLDLLLGTVWLENPGSLQAEWPSHTIGTTNGSPDRNALVDLDGDGVLEIVLGNEEIPSALFHFVPVDDPTQPWESSALAVSVGGVYSLDSGDIDNDGDIDLVLGEHKQGQRLLWFVNHEDSAAWSMMVIDSGTDGLDHHDGTQLVDIDLDGDLDVVSIGWNHNNVLLFINHMP